MVIIVYVHLTRYLPRSHNIELANGHPSLEFSCARDREFRGEILSYQEGEN